MRFLLDMPIARRTADWLKESGFDVVHAGDIGMARSEDIQIFDLATRERRIIITMDIDFAVILALTKAEGPGVVLLRMRRPNPTSIQFRLGALFQSHSEEEISSSITIVEDSRVRLRKLPIL